MAARTAEAGASTTVSAAPARVAGAILAMAVGLAVVLLAGFVQADALHDAAHDMRHATGFPCH